MNCARLTAALFTASLAFGADQTALPDFGDLSLDQLANIKITSFTNKQQKLDQVAAAIYVVTQEQIARSGLTSVPELLRLVPGLDVARVNASQWSVSARGPTGVFSNKLLVLIDGRSIYSPIFSGVYWDIGMPMLENIERIEVIRGPGATVWGANAVLGVINIITKNSSDTKGTLVSSAAGSSERGFGGVRTGGNIGSVNFRAYFGGSDQSQFSQQSGAGAGDGWTSVQGGFRLDRSGKKDTWMLKGDLFRNAETETAVTPSLITQTSTLAPVTLDSTAGNLTGEWRRQVSETGEIRFQSDYDSVNRPAPHLPALETRTWNTEFQYDFLRGQVHHISIGADGRLISERITPDQGIGFTFAPNKLTYGNFSTFAQDEMHFLQDKLLFSAGAKLERNYFSGWGMEPSASLLWMPRKHQSFWISAARALRTPDLVDRNADAALSVIPASPATEGLPLLVELKGSSAAGNEAVRDFEAGYRAEMSKLFSADLSLFYDRYSNVISYGPGPLEFIQSPVPHLTVNEVTGNDTKGIGKGAESSFAWQTLPNWKIEGSYTYTLVNTFLSPTAPAGSLNGAGDEPSRHKWAVQSYWNATKSLQIDAFLYWMSQVDFSGLAVPSYTRLDIQMGYRINRRWKVNLVGQNLLQSRHVEGAPELLTYYSYINRGLYLKSTWQF